MGFRYLFQAEDGIRDLVRSCGLGDVYKRQGIGNIVINPVCVKVLVPPGPDATSVTS